MEKKWHSKIKPYLESCKTVEVDLSSNVTFNTRRFAFWDLNNWQIKNDDVVPILLEKGAIAWRDLRDGETVNAWRKLAAYAVGLDGKPWTEKASTPEIPAGWTPVEIALPDRCDEVQLLDSTGAKGHGFHSNLDIADDWFWHTDTSTEFTHTIIAWREFPEPEDKLLKVGDTVTLTGKIIEIDSSDHLMPYKVILRGGREWWVRSEDVDSQREVW